jgi:enolase
MTQAIAHVDALEVLDSRGNPTVQARVTLSGGGLGIAAVPSGASTGAHEARELRDGNARRYRGRGVLRAVSHVRTEIAEALHGRDATDQAALDRALMELDGTPDKSRLGANALLAVSLAAALALADQERVPFYQLVARLAGPDIRPVLPLPMVNLLSGGKHAGAQVDFQDFLVVPRGARRLSEALEMVHAVWHAALDLLVSRESYQPLVADEGGLAPCLESNEAMLTLCVEAIERAGYRPGEEVAIALDVASTHFFREGRYRLALERQALNAEQMIARLEDWRRRYPILSVEDGLAEEDWANWPRLQARLGARCQILGDDLFVTDPARIERGVREQAANSVLIKVNQIGTLTEALQALRLTRRAGWNAVVSARSGDTEDAWLTDLAVGSGAGQIKIGSITRSERLAKYNRLLAIEHLDALPFAHDALDRFATA